MANPWTLGGLSLPELVRRTARESWEDSVFGQGGRMAFYQFLAIFPSLLLFLTLAGHVLLLGDHIRATLQDLSAQVLPAHVSTLVEQVMNELDQRAPRSFQLIPVAAGALWAAFNSTWAMIYGLNRAYEVEERRSSWRLSLTIVALTFFLLITAWIAVLAIFSGIDLRIHFRSGAIPLRALEWTILALSLWSAFAVLYRFAPNMRDHKWRWSTPGAACALILWIAVTFASHLYFDRFNDYSRTYGHLNGVAILLVWLYFANGAILIGGEMNSEIEKAARHRDREPVHSNRGAARPARQLH